ncbi:hypothetical protein NC653_041876 [Populus alba x Populus x berolinensis]|uniref:Uncharacterized protein n=1 Tax=Populus alba x Populus x berolinensis TaxID=444605 RepID=A0AAD6L9T5_9ROSI|nr:hypothetical protein NC653_041876 [Populus alba x Populus x berolinensis]
MAKIVISIQNPSSFSEKSLTTTPMGRVIRAQRKGAAGCLQGPHSPPQRPCSIPLPRFW